VVRAWTIARHKSLNEALAGEETTPLAIVGGLLLWILRLVLAPISTLSGFRRWVLEECPVAPGRRAGGTAPGPGAEIALRTHQAIAGRPAAGKPGSGPRSGTKTERFLALVAERHGPLSEFPLASVSRVCSELAPEADLNLGAARTALRRHVQATQNGSAS
jgi:hypothetical protein